MQLASTAPLSRSWFNHARYDAMGNLAAEYATGAPQGPGWTGRRYAVTDMLGSTRLMANVDGAAVSCLDFAPFGEELPRSLRADVSCYQQAPSELVLPGTEVSPKFTGKERDAETGLDYFGARYLSSAQGRFTSPDWSGAPQPVPYADLNDPQTFNLYAYARNNPIVLTDPDGHCPWCVSALVSVATGAAIRAATGQKVFDAKAILIDAGTGAIGAGLAGKFAQVRQLSNFSKLESNIAKSGFLGEFGEQAGNAARTGKEAFTTAAGKARVADNLADASTVLEVKNVAKIGAREATQIADEAAHAAATGRSMVLKTRPTTDVGSVQGLIDSGAVQHKILPNVGRNGLRQGLFTKEAAATGATTGAACNAGGTGRTCSQ